LKQFLLKTKQIKMMWSWHSTTVCNSRICKWLLICLKTRKI